MNNQIKVELLEVYGTDKDIASAAWVSSSLYENKKLRTDEDISRVVNMLADSSHGTPFESIIFKFWIRMSISTDRQFQTHRLQSSNGLSGRYRRLPTDFLDLPEDVEGILPKIEAKLSNGQEFDLFQAYYDVCETAAATYELAMHNTKKAKDSGKITEIEYKRIREFYRGVLPQHTLTERVSIMNLRSFSNFIKLRHSEHAQKEIQYVASEMLRLVTESNKCPIALIALERNKWNI